MLSFIIPVRDRSNARIQLCIDSINLHVEAEHEIIVVDYGSKEPTQINNAKLLRYDKNPVWNKSHALNLGIKAAKYDYFCTVDCDMIFTKDIGEKLVESLNAESFIFNTNVYRIKVKDLSSSVSKMLKKAWLWYDTNRENIYSKAVGGMQAFHKTFIEKVKGYDEAIGVYHGGMDNRIYEQAALSGLRLVDLNSPLFHQEHDKIKEQNYEGEEVKKAALIKNFKLLWLEAATDKRFAVNEQEVWGTDVPQQEKFLKLHDKIVSSCQEIICDRTDRGFNINFTKV